jgi:hypothetical protein
MNQSIHSKTITLPLLITLVLVCFGFLPKVAAQGVPGTYELSFCPGSILYVGQEVIPHAYVSDGSGHGALSGYVQFQVCWHGRFPQPSSACDIDRTARWRTIRDRWQVNPPTGNLCLGCLPADPGNACFDWGAVVNPRTVGFRFKYVSQGSGIADGMSLPKDVTWLPLP